MQPTTALRMFQPTKRMMRPVPVSFGVPGTCLTVTNGACFHRRRSRVVRSLVLLDGGEAGRILWKLDWIDEGHVEAMERSLICATGHTVSQRLRAMRKIPPELIPLGKPDLALQSGQCLWINRNRRGSRCRSSFLLPWPKVGC